MLYRPGASLSEQYIADFVTNKLAAGFVSVCCYRSVMRSLIARKSYSRVVGNQSHMQAIQPFLQSRKSGHCPEDHGCKTGWYRKVHACELFILGMKEAKKECIWEATTMVV